ncbi:MAG: protein kinase [Chloroflexi bacterium]|nr:protein kinase [Chloroflexota bacterium]
MSKEQVLRGNYNVMAVLAHGPHSVLYHGKARNAEQAEVAIKVWPTARVTTKGQRERVRQEIQALVDLKHPHILPIVAFAIEDLGISITRKYAPEGSLQTRLMRNSLKPLPFSEALTIIKQVGEALYAAHQQNITHGDLTPYNILFTAQDNAVLSDFQVPGILAAIENYTGEAAPLRWYMAPEQFLGTISAQSDQYALGCLAYQLFTGRVPFTGIARFTLQQKHTVEAPAALTTLNPTLPPRIERAVLKALAKDPTERYPDVQAFLEVLDGAGQLVRQLTTPVLNRASQMRTSIVNKVPWTIAPINTVFPVKRNANLYSATFQQEGVQANSNLEQPISPGEQRQRPTTHKRKGRIVQTISLIVLITLVVATAGVYQVFAPIISNKHNSAIAAFTNIVQAPAAILSPSHPGLSSGMALTQVPTKAPTPSPTAQPTPTFAAKPTPRPSPTSTKSKSG